MPASVSLRKTLRTMPMFHSLSSQELDAVVACVISRKYRAGDSSPVTFTRHNGNRRQMW
jgi:hypothetical protein